MTGLSCDWEVSVEGQKLVPKISQAQSLTAATLDVCKEGCVNESSAPCVAVNYLTADSRCELLLEREYTATAISTAGWKYYLRPACAGMPNLSHFAINRIWTDEKLYEASALNVWYSLSSMYWTFDKIFKIRELSFHHSMRFESVYINLRPEIPDIQYFWNLKSHIDKWLCDYPTWPDKRHP